MHLIFAKGKTAISDIIAKIDDTDVSHVALSSHHICDHNIVFHSSTKGVEIVSREYFKKIYDIKRIYEVGVKWSKSESEVLWHLMKNYEGASYDYLATAYIGVYLLAKKLGIPLKRHNIWNNRNHFMCLEFVTAGILREHPEMLSLKSLEELVIERLEHGRVSLY